MYRWLGKSDYVGTDGWVHRTGTLDRLHVNDPLYTKNPEIITIKLKFEKKKNNEYSMHY